MFLTQQHLTRFAWASLALLSLSLAAPVARAQAAETIVFRNDSPIAVYVHITAIDKGQARALSPFLLRSQATSIGITVAGDKIVTLYDARVVTRMLYKNTIRSNATNQTYSIQPDLPPPRLKLVPVVTP